MPHLTYKEIQKMEYDKQQTQFSLDGALIIKEKIINEYTPLYVLINENHKYLCPFCLEESNKFTIESHALIKCPNCTNQMKLKTLLFIKECSNQDFAKWVYEYRLSGFFKKINFEKWSKKLKELGIAYEFWEEYKKLKGTNTEPEPETFNEDELRIIINGLVELINQGISKEGIMLRLLDNGVEFNPTDFNYCYNEALNQIKREKE